MAFEIHREDKNGDQLIRLQDMESGTEAEIYPFGGLLNAFRIRNGNRGINLVDGFASPGEARQNITAAFNSTKLSPFVCRMREGKYVFEDRTYQIEHFFLARHAIHGILYDAGFTISHSHADAQSASVTLLHDYQGTDAGFPFPYTMEIQWVLEKQQQLSVTTRVTNTGSSKMPLADGWHPYFTLGGPVDDCTLCFTSNTQLEYDADLLPTGKTIPDNRFLKGLSLRGIELDNSFLLSSETGTGKCVFENRQYRITVLPDKSYPVLQLYIPSHRNSLAIENLSGPPDNFNNGMLLITLAPDEVKEFTTRYRAEVL
ncbi:MAG: aldose 1-epimerase [Bacteroidota bacterium]|nr:aldose 1-epimerase [Bacteroidota bacterium]